LEVLPDSLLFGNLSAVLAIIECRNRFLRRVVIADKLDFLPALTHQFRYRYSLLIDAVRERYGKAGRCEKQ
jgi:hypothetical protein